MIDDRDKLREALERLDKQRASGSEPGAVDFATVVEDESLDLICTAARLVLNVGAAFDATLTEAQRNFRAGAEAMLEDCAQEIKRSTDDRSESDLTHEEILRREGYNNAIGDMIEFIYGIPLPTPKGEQT